MGSGTRATLGMVTAAVGCVLLLITPGVLHRLEDSGYAADWPVAGLAVLLLAVLAGLSSGIGLLLSKSVNTGEAKGHREWIVATAVPGLVALCWLLFILWLVIEVLPPYLR